MRRTYFGGLSDEQASTPAARADIAEHAHGRSEWFRSHMLAWIRPHLRLGEGGAGGGGYPGRGGWLRDRLSVGGDG